MSRSSGSHVSPDLDTVTYTARRSGESATGVGSARRHVPLPRGPRTVLRRAPGSSLGDRDLATHVYRTERLRAGARSRASRAEIARALGRAARVLPMTDDRVRTLVTQRAGHTLAFQDYLVRGRGRGRVRRIEIVGAASARARRRACSRPSRGADAIVCRRATRCVSIGPILGGPGVRRALARGAPASSRSAPLVGGRPIKGPLHACCAASATRCRRVGVAALPRASSTCFVIDRRDARLDARASPPSGMRVRASPTRSCARPAPGGSLARARPRGRSRRAEPHDVAVIPVPGLPLSNPATTSPRSSLDAIEAARVRR